MAQITIRNDQTNRQTQLQGDPVDGKMSVNRWRMYNIRRRLGGVVGVDGVGVLGERGPQVHPVEDPQYALEIEKTGERYDSERFIEITLVPLA